MDNLSIYTYFKSKEAAQSAAESESLLRCVVERSVTELSFSYDDITSIGAYTFANYSTLEKIDLPKVENLGNYAFQGCAALEDVNLPSLKRIGYASLNTCRVLTEIDLPKCVSINAYAFGTCSTLSKIILRSTTLCNLVNANAFAGTPIASGTGYIYVPDDLVSQYKSHAQWSTYAAQIKPISELPGGA